MQKLNIQQLPDIFKEVVTASYDSTLNRLTLTSVKGDNLVVELSPTENYVLDAAYSTSTHKVTVTYLDNTTKELDLSELYNIYTGSYGSDIDVSVDANNRITAAIKVGVIGRDKLTVQLSDELDGLRDDINANNDDITTLQGRLTTDETDISTNATEIAGIKTRLTTDETQLNNLEQYVENQTHFLGYYATTAEITALTGENGDFAYNAQTGTKWTYNSGSWTDSMEAVPDQTVPKSTITPLMNGTAATGTSNTYAAGDHVHPTDTTRASATSLTNHTSNRSNPHEVTKAQVGLGNVENKSSATIRGELTYSNVTDALEFIPLGAADISGDGIITDPWNGVHTYIGDGLKYGNSDSSGNTPIEVNFGNGLMIDPNDKLSIDCDAGFQFNSGALNICCGKGITTGYDSSTGLLPVEVNAGDGLGFGSDTELKIKADEMFDFDSNGEMHLFYDTGLIRRSDGALEVSYSQGITSDSLSSGQIAIKAYIDEGLKFKTVDGEDAIAVKTGSGLKINSSTKAVETSNIVYGYYRSNNFYTTQTGSTLCEKNTNYIYIDLKKKEQYRYTGSAFEKVNQLATSGPLYIYDNSNVPTIGVDVDRGITVENGSIGINAGRGLSINMDSNNREILELSGMEYMTKNDLPNDPIPGVLYTCSSPCNVYYWNSVDNCYEKINRHYIHNYNNSSDFPSTPSVDITPGNSPENDQLYIVKNLLGYYDYNSATRKFSKAQVISSVIPTNITTTNSQLADNSLYMTVINPGNDYPKLPTLYMNKPTGYSNNDGISLAAFPSAWFDPIASIPVTNSSMFIAKTCDASWNDHYHYIIRKRRTGTSTYNTINANSSLNLFTVTLTPSFDTSRVNDIYINELKGRMRIGSYTTPILTQTDTYYSYYKLSTVNNGSVTLYFYIKNTSSSNITLYNYDMNILWTAVENN